MSAFECLYFLDNFYLSLVEVKRIDLPTDAPASERFLWLRIEKDTMEIFQLNFRSMDSSGEIEERYFQEGFLKFNDTIGTFIEKYNSAQHPLERVQPAELPSELAQSITCHLQNIIMATFNA